MRIYGNLMNRIAEHTIPVMPRVGDGGTIYMHSDRLAVTVERITISRAKVITIFAREDHAERTDTNGMSESQTYEYKPDPEGRLHVIKMRKINGQKVWRCGNDGVNFGRRDAYHDYSF